MPTTSSIRSAYHRGEDTKSPAKGILEPIKEIKALSPTQIAITLKSGNADFPYLLGDYHIIVVPKDFTDWQKLIGTGAYTLESFEPGVRLVFKNRGDYWKAGRAQLRHRRNPQHSGCGSPYRRLAVRRNPCSQPPGCPHR